MNTKNSEPNWKRRPCRLPTSSSSVVCRRQRRRPSTSSNWTREAKKRDGNSGAAGARHFRQKLDPRIFFSLSIAILKSTFELRRCSRLFFSWNARAFYKIAPCQSCNMSYSSGSFSNIWLWRVGKFWVRIPLPAKSLSPLSLCWRTRLSLLVHLVSVEEHSTCTVIFTEHFIEDLVFIWLSSTL